MKNRLFFDSNVRYGVRTNNLEARWSKDHLLEDMDHYGISASLVRHDQAINFASITGNKALLKDIRDDERLFPCCMVAPNIGGDMQTIPELHNMLVENDIRAVQLAPSLINVPAPNHYPVVPEIMNPIAEVLAEKKILILIDWNHFSDHFRDIRALCEINVKKPVLLTNCKWDSYRMACSLLEVCPNLHLELSIFQANRVLELLVPRFGSERFIFGSGSPVHSAGAARGLLDWGSIESKDIDAIAGLNLCRLLRIEPEKLITASLTTEPIQEKARNGERLNNLVLDAHCHVVEADQLSVSNCTVIEGNAKKQLEISKRCGIDMTAITGWQALIPEFPKPYNDLMVSVIKENPNSFIGVTMLDPIQQTPEEMLETLKYYHEKHGFAGIKLYYGRNEIYYNSPLYDVVWEYADKHHLYGLLHTDFTQASTLRVLESAKRYPNVNFIFAHVGGNWNFAKYCAEAAQKVPNIYCELNLTPVLNGIIEYLVEHAGSDRVLFGTDAPLRDPRPQLGWVVHSRLSTEEKKKVLGINFLNILRKNKMPQMVSIVNRLDSISENYNTTSKEN